jgi:hypothetical protein
MTSPAVMVKVDGDEVRRAHQAASGGENEALLRLGIRQRARLYEISRAFSELVELDQLLPIVIAETKSLFDVESSAIKLLAPAPRDRFGPQVAHDEHQDRAAR